MNGRSTFDIKYAVAVGAGLAAALLCLAARQGTVPALVLVYFAPLPIMIATLGFGPFSGLGAALVSIATIALFVFARAEGVFVAKLIAALFFGGVFAILPSLPAWWLARLSRLRQTDTGTWRDAAHESAAKAFPPLFYPLGRIAAQTIVLAGLAVIVIFTIAVVAGGGFDALINSWAGKIAPDILYVVGTREVPAGVDLQELARLYVQLFPPLLTASYVCLLAINLWLAGRIVQISRLLPRPWPDVAEALQLPRLFAVAFLASLALCVLGGFVGTLAACAAAAFGMGFVLQGLATIHALTRGVKFRNPLLGALYVAAILVPPMLIPLLVIGALDAVFAFRNRRSDPAASPKTSA